MNLKRFNVILLLFSFCCFRFSLAAEETYTVTLKVTSVTNDNLKGTPVKLVNTDFALNYPDYYLSDQGECSISGIYPGTHSLTIQTTGLGLAKYVDNNLEITKNEEINVTLQEETRTPYALKAEKKHDVNTGRNDVILNWNNETDYFFDDFESYDAFSIDFAPWTGIDGDKDPAAQIQGAYPNSGIVQYATIFNPLTISPPVWYSYPVMRPYSGKQYVAFIRTSSGTANNDWLISPKIKVGVNNVVRFMAKAADRYKEEFKVGVSTTGTEMSDFEFLTPGNYETVDYKAWKTIEYNLEKYEGKEVYITIQYVSKSYFMLMVDDFYVGPANISPSKVKRIGRHSATNPYEKFKLYLDGGLAGETDKTSYTFENLTSGTHTLSVQAVYRTTETEKSSVEVTIEDASHYAGITLNVTTNNNVPANGFIANYINIATGEQINDAINEGQSKLNSLEKGEYLINISPEGYEAYNENLTLVGDTIIDVKLKEKIVTPYNITVDCTPSETEGKSDALLKWNQDLGVNDSFETYEDFSQQFGEWTTIDLDGMPPYAVGLGSPDNIVTFPGSGEPAPCMIFNPLTTEPSMESDAGMLAPDGDKFVAFFSAQAAQSNDWLISPVQKIREGYVVKFVVRSYEPMYPETLQIMISESKEPDSFEELDQIIVPSEWTQYKIDLTPYAGKEVYLGFHYISNDKFLLQFDMFYVGPGEDNENPNTVTGNVTYEIYLNDKKQGDTPERNFTFRNLTDGETYKAGIKAIYVSGESEVAEYEFICNNGTSAQSLFSENIRCFGDRGCIQVTLPSEEDHTIKVYDFTGRTVIEQVGYSSGDCIRIHKGIYLVELIVKGETYRQKVLVK